MKPFSNDIKAIGKIDLTLKPRGRDKKGDIFLRSDLDKVIIKETILGHRAHTKETYSQREEIKMTKEIELVGDAFDEAASKVGKKIQSFDSKVKDLTDTTKKATSHVKRSSNDLLVSIEKLNKIADFEKLERLAQTLESICTSISSLSALEKSGQLAAVARSITESPTE
jgi:methyl-accepting chemotaxis protein